MQKRLAGKVALVTGGTSGIGAGAVRRLAAEGAAVVFTGSNAAAAADLVPRHGEGGLLAAAAAEATAAAKAEAEAEVEEGAGADAEMEESGADAEAEAERLEAEQRQRPHNLLQAMDEARCVCVCVRACVCVCVCARARVCAGHARDRPAAPHRRDPRPPARYMHIRIIYA